MNATLVTSSRLVTVLLLLALSGTVLCDDEEDFKLDPLPDNTTYASAGAEYDDGGMGPLYDFARSFINSALPGGFDQDFIEDIFDNGFSVDKGKELLMKNIGYVIAIAIGFLFVLVLPIVGCCFCCCRGCGNCGGRRVQEQTESIHCRRRVYSCVMFVITVFILVGNICTYVSNDRLSQALGNIGDTVEHNLNDIDLFLDELTMQIHTIGETNLKKTEEATLEYMNKDNLTEFISEYMLDTLSDGALNQMDKHIQELGRMFDGIKAKALEVNSTFHTMCPSSCPITNPMNSTTALYELVNTAIPKFKNFSESDPIGKAKKTIKDKVNSTLTDMTSTAQTVKDAFGEIGNQTGKITDQINKFRNDTKGGFDIQSISKETKSMADTMKTYDKYRHIAGAVLGAMITIVVVLMFIGIAFGILGQGTKTAPTERGCVSNSGGNMLIAGVAFIFIFSSLLMLLTTLCFSVGAIVERFLCQPLSDPDLTLLKFVGKHIPGDILANSSLDGIMLECKSDKTVYQAFPLLQSKFNISEVQENMAVQLDTMNKKTSESLENITSAISSASFATDATNNLDNLKNSLASINFTAIENQRELIQTADQFGAVAKPFTTAMNEVLEQVKLLKPYQAKVGNWSTEFKNGMDKAQTKISNTTTVNKTVQSFVDRVIEPVDTYVNQTRSDVETRMGRCGPLWNMYNSIAIISICKYTIDAFNGFWFSIGWCLFFFMPGIVVAVKLAKHYRRMEEPNEDESYLNMQQIKNNQVAPSDEPVAPMEQP